MSSVTRALGFYAIPSSKSRFLTSVKESQILSSILRSDCLSTDTLNAPSTLPLSLKPKAEIFKQTEQENPDASKVSLKIKQSFAYAKSLIGFYKSGVRNVWNNHKEMKQLMKNKYKLTKHIDSHGNDVDIRIPGLTKLTQEMSQAIYLSQVEHKARNQATEGDVKKSIATSVDQGLFSMTRSEYQLIKRTPSDFYRIPFFAVIFAIFMETTPIVCYAIPEITPSTCVLPSMLPKMWNSQTVKQLRDLRQQPDLDLVDEASKNAYNLPLEQVRLLCKSLRLTSKYIPSFAYPESWLRNKLHEYYNYLRVDNYYLAGLNGDGNIWNLSHQELQRAALERNLILDLNQGSKHFDSITDEATKAVEEEKYFNDLKVKLFQFIVDFDSYNIGYLGVAHLGLENPTKVLEWKE